MEKQRREESEKRRAEERRSEKRIGQEKKMQAHANVRKVAKHFVFPMICCSGGPKSRLAKAAGAEPSGQMRDEKLHAVVARSTFGSQNVPDTPFSDQFWKLRCRKSARRCGASTFGSQNVQSTSYSDDFWKLRYRKSAHRCGAKNIWKSRCTKHRNSGTLLEVEISKKCTPLWCEAHFEVKSTKNSEVRGSFGRSDVVSRGRRRGLCTLSKVSQTWGFCGSFSCNHHWTARGFTTLPLQLQLQLELQLQLQLQLKLKLHYTALHYTELH